MKFNTGDQVSFINEKQNGVVVKILSNDKVMVEIEDGFEIEVYEKELVKTGVMKSELKQVEPTKVENQELETASELTSLCDKGTICIIALPASIGGVLTGPIQYHLTNNSDHQLLYTFYVKEKNNMKGIQKGILEPGASSLLFTRKREDLIDISSFLIQGLLFSENHMIGTGNFRKETGIVLPDLQIFNKALKGNTAYAKTITVYSDAAPIEDIDIKELIEQYQKSEAPKSVKSETKKQNTTQAVFLNEKEVDLHIEELRTNFSGLSNGEMVQIQLEHFHKEMDNAMRNHYKKIVFIHGVGNGRLKQEIRQELRSYSGIAFRDGDHSKYGYGATEVLFM